LRYDRRLAVQAYHDLFAGLNQARSAA